MNNWVVPAFALLLLGAASALTLALMQAPPGGAEDLGVEGILSCKNSTLRERELCYDLYVSRLMERNGTGQLMAALERAVDGNDDLTMNCHDVAHSIGRVSMLKSDKSLSDIFSECTQTCHSGCFHGAMQALFLKETLPGSDIYELRDEHVSVYDMKRLANKTCSGLEGEGAKWFQCLHGMGHAIQFNVDNNLPVALDICDMLATDYERNSCYGGVVMENVVSVNRDTRFIRADSPQYPCSELDEKYKYQCYMMQTSVMLEIFNYDLDKVAAACMDAGSYTGTCYLSLGRDISGDFRIGNDRPYTTLEKVPEQYRMDYIRGLIYALADNSWDGRYAFPFCSGLKDQELKGGCYSTATVYLNSYLAVGLEQIEGFCRTQSPEADYCLGHMPEARLSKPY